MFHEDILKKENEKGFLPQTQTELALLSGKPYSGHYCVTLHQVNELHREKNIEQEDSLRSMP